MDIDNRLEKNNANNSIPEYKHTSYERNKEISVNHISNKLNENNKMTQDKISILSSPTDIESIKETTRR